MLKLTKTRSYQDTAWKEILDNYAKDCIHYCLPHLSALVDWTKPLTALDKEFQAITKGIAQGRRLLDKLFKVALKDGREQWVLLHLEIQGSPDRHFPKRMFTYAYRIYDKYQQPVVSCAILTDDKMQWRPNYYEIGLAGSYLRLNYLVIKLMDYLKDMPQLAESNNPFASVLFIQLTVMQAKNKTDEQKKHIKFALTKRLYEKGFNKNEILSLYNFIDWLIGLPEPLELEYAEDIHHLEEATKMRYISSAERIGMQKGMQEGMQKGREKGIEEGIEEGIEKGIQKGLQKGKEEVAEQMLAEGLDLNLIVRITRLTLDRVKELQRALKDK